MLLEEKVDFGLNLFTIFSKGFQKLLRALYSMFTYTEGVTGWLQFRANLALCHSSVWSVLF